MSRRVKILEKERLNYNVIRLRLEKPKDYSFVAGQAIELSIDEPVRKGPGPFTFTSLTSAPYLELMIKIYGEHNGLTSALADKKPGDTVIISDPWDSFTNKGPGVFIAGGAGITPFIALLRHFKADNIIGDSSLFFSNKTSNDIFLERELKELLGSRYHNVLTREQNGSPGKHIDENFLKKHISNFNQPFYVCGPPGFVESIQRALTKLGADEKLVNISL